MAETIDPKKKFKPNATSDKVFWIKRDAIADTFSVVIGTEAEYQSDTGTVAFQIKDASTLKSTTTIPEENRGSVFDQNIIESNGGQSFLKLAVGQGIGSIGNQRINLEATDPNATLPTIGDGALLDNFLQKSTETVSNLTSQVIDAVNNPLKNVPDTTNKSYKNLIGGGGVLKYPSDMDTSVQDHLQISVFSYKPAKQLPTINTAVDTTRNLRQQQGLEIIQIPVPNSVADQNTVEWGGGRMTSTAGELGKAVVQPLLQEGTDNIAGGFEALGDTATGIGKAALEAISNPFIRRRFIANKIAGAISGALGINFDINQAITRLGGVVENPNLELLFTGPALRTFSFTVRFTPRSDTEAKRVRNIIRVLKQRSAVKKGVKFFSGEGGDNLLLGTPDVFKLEYKNVSGNIKGVNKIKTCALTGLSVDYTGGSGRWSTYEVDSQPVTTIVQMNFSELAPIYDTDYGTGEKTFFSDDDVGF